MPLASYHFGNSSVFPISFLPFLPLTLLSRAKAKAKARPTPKSSLAKGKKYRGKEKKRRKTDEKKNFEVKKNSRFPSRGAIGIA